MPPYSPLRSSADNFAQSGRALSRCFSTLHLTGITSALRCIVSEHNFSDKSAGCFTAEQAFAERVVADKAINLLQARALGKTSEGEMEAVLAGFQPSVPQMPQTAAVLASIPASGGHPGAHYRLAGDR